MPLQITLLDPDPVRKVANLAATLPQTLAPGVAGAIVLSFGYAGLFPIGIVLSVLGAFAVWPIKGVR